MAMQYDDNTGTYYDDEPPQNQWEWQQPEQTPLQMGSFGVPASGGNPAGYQDLSYWQSRHDEGLPGAPGVNDIFDANGQMMPGWARTGKGYEQVPVQKPAAGPAATGGVPTTYGSYSPGGSGGYRFGSPAFQPGSYDFPSLDLPEMEAYPDYVPDPWNAPDPKDIYNDPSYEFRFNEGLRPIKNSRAAQGLTRTGATLKALSRYGQGFASNEYDRIYDRAADSYDRTQQARFGAWQGNRQSRLDRYDRRVNELSAEFAPKQRWAELQFGRDFDLYKYQNDDAFRYYNANLNAATTGAGYGNDEP